MNLREYVNDLFSQSHETLPFGTSLKTVEKGTVITDYQDLEDSVYFIQSGILYTSIRYQEERILDFHFKNSFCASYSSLLSGRPCDTRITGYTDCLLEVIDYTELKQCYRTSLLANQLGRVATEGLFLDRVTREKELLTMTAQERYASLLKKRPEIVQHIAIKDISKYLGVRPESLSRIRRT